MIYKSSDWKRELRTKKHQITKYNTSKAFDKDFHLAYHKVESGLLYSAFIIRKLIESMKLSDDADNYNLHIKQYTPLHEINRIHCFFDTDDYDLMHSSIKTVKGKDVCNWLIHSYILALEFDKDSSVISFFVSSDYDRNKKLSEITLNDWVKYMDFIICDFVVSLNMEANDSIQDYILKSKKGGY